MGIMGDEVLVMRRFGTRMLAWATILLLPFVGGRAFAQEPPGERWAVLIGVNDYADLNDLQYGKSDAATLAERLTQAGFTRENVFLLADGAADSKDLPTRSNIETRIRNVLRVAEPGDLVLVSFSGHGVHLDGKTYLCPADARTESPATTMIPLQVVYDNLNRCRAARKLLWVDACRNDPWQSGSRSATEHARSAAGVLESLRAPPEGILTLASCAAGQVSWEENQFGHGVFMHYLLEGIGGAADRDERGNRDNRVSLLELYNYANIKTKRYVLNSRDRVQTPELFGRITGDFDIFEPESARPVEITNSIGMKLRLIPAGEFLMGSGESAEILAKVFEKYGKPPPKADFFEDERPQHRVRITRPFYLGAYEVTLGQFLMFYHDAKYRTEAERDAKGGWGFTGKYDPFEQRPQFVAWNTGFAQTNNHPVVNVSWNDAVAFCQWLSRKESKTYRLPTEAEWEYACRAGTRTRYYFGDDIEGLATVGNVGDGTLRAEFGVRTDTISARDGYLFTAAVGQFKPNGFGLYDMHGNVWEWCADWYAEDYYANSPIDDPKGPPSGRWRVYRSGGWWDYPGNSRSADRGSLPPGETSIHVGFRVALDPSE